MLSDMRLPATTGRRWVLVAVAVSVTASLCAVASASASTALCESNVELCPAEDVYPIGTTFSASATAESGLRLTTAFTTQECANSTLKWKTTETSEPSGNLVGQVQSLSFEGCTPGNSSCTVAEALNLPWRIELDSEPAFGPEVLLSNGGSGLPTIRRFCKLGGLETKCNYAVEVMGLGMGVLPGETEETAIEAKEMMARHESSTQCPTTMQWDGLYASLSPKAFLTAS
jgi:hypothetical protein